MLILLLLFVLLVCLLLSYRRVRFWLHSPRLFYAQRIFNKLYCNTQTYAVSHQERRRLNLKDPEYIYGEVEFDSYVKLLTITKPKPSDVFYDLGSGAGKAVIITALVYPELAKVVGLELLPALHQLSEEKLTQLQQLHPNKASNVQFIQTDFLKHNLSDATLIFVNAAAFMPDFWQTVIHKLDQVKSGCRIIVSSKYLPADQYELLNTGTYLMGWGDAGVNVYIKK